MSLADWLLLAGAAPTVYVAYWMMRGTGLLLTRPDSQRLSVTLRVGGPYVLLVFLLSLASLVGVVLTIT